MNRKITTLLLIITSSINCFSQTKKDTTQISNNTITEIRGLVLDNQNQLPLPYTNIIVKSQNRGVITNEKGDFLLNISNLKETEIRSTNNEGSGITVINLESQDCVMHGTYTPITFRPKIDIEGLTFSLGLRYILR